MEDSIKKGEIQMKELNISNTISDCLLFSDKGANSILMVTPPGLTLMDGGVGASNEYDSTVVTIPYKYLCMMIKKLMCAGRGSYHELSWWESNGDVCIHYAGGLSYAPIIFKIGYTNLFHRYMEYKTTVIPTYNRSSSDITRGVSRKVIVKRLKNMIYGKELTNPTNVEIRATKDMNLLEIEQHLTSLQGEFKPVIFVYPNLVTPNKVSKEELSKVVEEFKKYAKLSGGPIVTAMQEPKVKCIDMDNEITMYLQTLIKTNDIKSLRRIKKSVDKAIDDIAPVIHVEPTYSVRKLQSTEDFPTRLEFSSVENGNDLRDNNVSCKCPYTMVSIKNVPRRHRLFPAIPLSEWFDPMGNPNPAIMKDKAPFHIDVIPGDTSKEQIKSELEETITKLIKLYNTL